MDEEFSQVRPCHWLSPACHERRLSSTSWYTVAGPSPTKKPADVPGGAGDSDPVSDEFAELDKLTGLDYERALAGMSEEKRERYNRLG